MPTPIKAVSTLSRDDSFALSFPSYEVSHIPCSIWLPKESEPDRLPRTLATSDSTTSTAPSNGPQTPDEHPNNCQPRQKVCKFCNKENWLHECYSFKELKCEKRQEFVKENRLCFNCLREGHSSRYCSLRLRCKECNRRHNTVLHRENLAQTDEKKPAEPAATAMCAYSKKSIAFQHFKRLFLVVSKVNSYCIRK